MDDVIFNEVTGPNRPDLEIVRGCCDQIVDMHACRHETGITLSTLVGLRSGVNKGEPGRRQPEGTGIETDGSVGERAFPYRSNERFAMYSFGQVRIRRSVRDLFGKRKLIARAETARDSHS